MTETKIIPIELLIEPPNAMRFSIDEERLKPLADSIRAIGLREPLNVRPEILPGEVTTDQKTGLSHHAEPKPTGRYIIDAGHRRYLACRMIGLTHIKCEVETDLSIDSDTVMIAENTHRLDSTPLEEANKFAEIADRPGMTEERLQQLCGHPLTYIYSRLELLRGDADISLAVHEGKITLAVAKILNRMNAEFWKRKGHEATPEEWARIEAECKTWRKYYLDLAIDSGTSAKQAEGWVRQWESTQGLRPPQPEPQMITPTVTVQPHQLCCALCGQVDRPFDLETVMICRSEFYAIRSAMRAEREGGQ